jgi:hypothetical protein
MHCCAILRNVRRAIYPSGEGTFKRIHRQITFRPLYLLN